MKNFKLILAALLALASCKEGTLPETGATPVAEISVRSAGDATKSVFNGTDFPAGYDMLVSAYRNLDGDVKGQDTASNYFEGVQFAKSGTVWKGLTPKYWPLTGSLDLLCIASAGLHSASSGIVPTCVWNTSNVAGGVALTVPDNSAKFDDLLFGSSNAQTRDAEGNEVKFRHAMSAVVFTAKASETYNAESNTGITIESITIDGAKYAGTLTVSNPKAGGNADGGDISAIWSNLGSPVEHLKARVWDSGNTGVKIDEAALDGLNLTDKSAQLNAKPFGEAYVILPQQSAVPFTVTYTVHNGFKADGKTKIDNKLQYQYTPAEGTWTQGQKNVYDLSFTLGSLEISPTVVDWTSSTTTVSVG